MNTPQTLNLARKWRSTTFDQIVGQELIVRMLKNSLYVGHIFPVYLFAGQRGCGKTSTARIFATALNCYNLSQFRKSPKEIVIPCLTCNSCTAMQKGTHPDFIEIDAASHTGVDNVRAIIEASTLMPLIGEKKIYLIDEAHMLSKAAFNAFLKILEEPPHSVVFILATTDKEKILETIRSRCFQLFFKPINQNQLFNHLQAMCLTENINHDRAGLEMIVKESQGSARDAINLLEQVRFAYNSVTIVSVSHVLGHVDDRIIINILSNLLTGNAHDILTTLEKLPKEGTSLEFIWNRIILFARTILWKKYGITHNSEIMYTDELDKLAQKCSLLKIQSLIMLMHKEYATFIKTVSPESFFEILCLSFCTNNKNSSNNDSQNNSGGSITQSPSAQSSLSIVSDVVNQEEDNDTDEEDSDQENQGNSWSHFITSMHSHFSNPLLLSVLKQGIYTNSLKNKTQITVAFPKDMQFFSDTLVKHTTDIENSLLKYCGSPTLFLFSFTHSVQQPQQINSELTHKQPVSQLFIHKQVAPKNDLFFDISDKKKWKRANLLIELFPGTITEIREQKHEQHSS